MPDTNTPIRVQLLQEGLKLTAGERNETYGDPIDNFTLAGNLKKLFWAGATRNIGPAEKEAIDMIMVKLARLARGEKPHRDNYADGAVYFACAGEVAELEHQASIPKVNSPLPFTNYPPVPVTNLPRPEPTSMFPASMPPQKPEEGKK